MKQTLFYIRLTCLLYDVIVYVHSAVSITFYLHIVTPIQCRSISISYSSLRKNKWLTIFYNILFFSVSLFISHIIAWREFCWSPGHCVSWVPGSHCWFNSAHRIIAKDVWSSRKGSVYCCNWSGTDNSKYISKLIDLDVQCCRKGSVYCCNWSGKEIVSI